MTTDSIKKNKALCNFARFLKIADKNTFPLLQDFLHNYLKIRYLIYFSIFGCQLLYLQSAMAQIVDDTTKRIHGPKTTLVYYEWDIMDGNERKNTVDTSLNALHQFNHVNKFNNFYQDLGSWGTALRPMFYFSPTQIGTLAGINAYQPFLFTPQNVRYFDTKSPFTNAYYVQGARGDQSIDFIYTRNINPNWNIGANYIRLNSNRQYGAESNRDVAADHISTVIFTSYLSKNKKYRLLYHFSHLNQTVKETGGVLLKPAEENNGIFGYIEADANLGQAAQSWQTRNIQHLYHHYALDKGFTVFHVLDIERQRDTYNDIAVGDATHYRFYPVAQVIKGDTTFFIDNDRTSEGTVFRKYENKFGIKGKFGKFNYQAFFKNRIFNWRSELEGQVLRSYNQDSVLISTIQPSRLSGFENFIGGKLFYQFNDSTRLVIEAEHLLARDFLLQGIMESKFFKAGVKSVFYSPTALQRRFFSNHFFWQRNYSNTLANEIFGGITLKTKSILFNPHATYSLLTNYIYFDENAQPQQTDKTFQLFRVGLNFNYRVWRFNTVNNVYYNALVGENLFRVPTWFVNSRVYCEDCLIKKLLHSQIGFEFHYKSNYFADGYMPVTKQFHLQNDFLVKSYLIPDVFANFQVDTFRIFLKFSHLNQLPDNGYITTPIYPGMRRTFTFGVNWQFFN